MQPNLNLQNGTQSFPQVCLFNLAPPFLRSFLSDVGGGAWEINVNKTDTYVAFLVVEEAAEGPFEGGFKQGCVATTGAR